MNYVNIENIGNVSAVVFGTATLGTAIDKEKGYQEISVNQLQFGVAHPNPDGIDPTTEYMTEEAYAFHKQTKMPVFSFSSQSAGYFFRKDENGNHFMLEGRHFVKFIGDIPNWYFKCGLYSLKSKETIQIGNYLRIIE